jgi:hypothetical protein
MIDTVCVCVCLCVCVCVCVFVRTGLLVRGSKVDCRIGQADQRRLPATKRLFQPRSLLPVNQVVLDVRRLHRLFSRGLILCGVCVCVCVCVRVCCVLDFRYCSSVLICASTVKFHILPPRFIMVFSGSVSTVCLCVIPCVWNHMPSLRFSSSPCTQVEELCQLLRFGHQGHCQLGC